MQENVLMLGAGTFQIGFIKYLNRTGFETHVVTNRPHDPGIKEAKYCHLIDYQDKEKVLLLCEKLQAVQIFTAASEASLHTQSYIQSSLGLAGYSLEFINSFVDKAIYKRKLQESNLNGIPKVALCSDKNQVKCFFLDCSLTGVLIKPRVGSGSTQVKHLSTVKEMEAYQFSGNPKDYLVEEFIEGTEHGGDFLVHHGSVIFYWPTQKKVNECKVPVSHLMLEEMKEIQLLIFSFLQEITNALRLLDGIYNADVIVRESRPYLIDLAPRIGGNCIPNLALLSFGVNEWKFTTELLTDKNISPIQPTWKQPYGVFIIGSDHEGMIAHLANQPLRFKKQVVEIFWKVRKGEKVEKFTEGSKHLGYVIYKSSHDQELLELQKAIESYPWFSLV